jgi:ribonuclease-3
MSEMERVALLLGHTFEEHVLLQEALTHRSHAVENGGFDNERLEFLGDAVLELVITQSLMIAFPEATEGQLSRIRAAMVRTESLADLGRVWHLGTAILLGKGEAATEGGDKDTVLAGAVEALLGALYTDAGLVPCERIIHEAFSARIGAIVDPSTFGRDPKSALQEEAMALAKLMPVYTETDMSGPPHNRRYTIEVEVPGIAKAKGQGRSKRNAQREAAAAALEQVMAHGQNAPSPGQNKKGETE